MKKIKYFLRYLKYYKRSCKNTYKISIFKRIKAFIHGFTPDEYYLFDFDNNDMKDYLSEFKRLYYRKKINGEEFTEILDNKLLFKMVVGNSFEISNMVCWKNEGVYFDENNKISDLEQIVSSLKGMYFCKPLGSGGGFGVCKILIGDQCYLDDSLVEIDTIKEELHRRKDFMLEKYVYQREYSNNIFNKSVNTIRMVTVKDENNNIILVKAVHRFGIENSAPTDNFCRGGLACNIDIQTGVMRKAKGRKHPRFVLNHPDTGSPIEGTIVPDWNDIKQKIIDCHKKIAFLKYISWDVVLLEKGFVIIEANASCGTNLLQLEEGIRNNEHIYKLYKKLGALK